MHINFDKIFPRPSKPPITIRTKRNMRLTIDGISQHVPTGSEVTISHREFSDLEVDDRDVVASHGPKIEVIDPTPLRPEPATAPASWKSLPACFTEFFNAEAQIAVARQHIDLIRSKRKEIFGVADIDFTNSTGTILAGEFTAEPNKNAVSTLRPINFDDPKNQKLARFLKNAEATAEDYLARLIETTNFPQQRRFLECGQHRLDTAEELQGVIDDLAGVGLALFTLRIGALGLADFQVRKLFHGSADYVAYGSHPLAYVGGICWAGMAEDGVTMRRYSDLPIPSTASHLLSDRARLAELKPLLVQAKKELAKAQKANLPAGLPA